MISAGGLINVAMLNNLRSHTNSLGFALINAQVAQKLFLEVDVANAY